MTSESNKKKMAVITVKNRLNSDTVPTSSDNHDAQSVAKPFSKMIRGSKRKKMNSKEKENKKLDRLAERLNAKNLATTDIIAEFLTAVMAKDYERAFKYCKLIIEYEPKNATANEFYELIYQQIYNTSFQKKFSNEISSSDEDDDSSDKTSNSETSEESESEHNDGKLEKSSLAEKRLNTGDEIPENIANPLEAESKPYVRDTVIDIPDESSGSAIEPVSQEIIDFLRAKVIPQKQTSNADNENIL